VSDDGQAWPKLLSERRRNMKVVVIDYYDIIGNKKMVGMSTGRV
jgi:hypothetical protein